LTYLVHCAWFQSFLSKQLLDEILPHIRNLIENHVTEVSTYVVYNDKVAAMANAPFEPDAELDVDDVSTPSTPMGNSASRRDSRAQIQAPTRTPVVAERRVSRKLSFAPNGPVVAYSVHTEHSPNTSTASTQREKIPGAVNEDATARRFSATAFQVRTKAYAAPKGILRQTANSIVMYR